MENTTRQVWKLLNAAESITRGPSRSSRIRRRSGIQLNTNNRHRDYSVNSYVYSLLGCSFANVTVNSYETSMCCVKSQLSHKHIVHIVHFCGDVDKRTIKKLGSFKYACFYRLCRSGRQLNTNNTRRDNSVNPYVYSLL